MLEGNAILDAVKVTSDQGLGRSRCGDDRIIRNVEVDGSDTGARRGVGLVGNPSLPRFRRAGRERTVRIGVR